jgi:hypothetical protein
MSCHKAEKPRKFDCKINDCGKITTIRPDDINTPGGYPITVPGLYCLEKDTNWVPHIDGESAINVFVGDVVIFLKKRTIKQTDRSKKNNIAINVYPNVLNVQILDGHLSGISGLGILVQDGADTVIIRKITGTDLGYGGSFSDLELPVPLFNRPFAGGLFARGRSTNLIKNIIVEECIWEDFAGNFPTIPPATAPAGGENGMTFIFTNNGVINRNNANRITSNDAAACIFLGVTNNINIDGDRWTGASGNRNSNGLDTMAGPTRSNTRLTIQNVYIADIVTNPASITANEALGLEPNAIDFVFKNIFITNVTNNGASATVNRASGFQTSGCIRGLIENCEAFNISSNGALNNSVTGSSGFSADSSSAFITYKNCKSKNIVNIKANTLGSSEGFRSQLGSNIVFENCSAQNVTAAFGAVNAIGFSIRGGNDNILVGSISSNNGIGVKVSTDTGTASVRNLIEKNIINNSSVNGILDIVPGTNNQYSQNKVSGANVLTNISGVPAGTPIRTWTIGAPPAPTDNNGIVDPLDNINIQQ